jgi:hypothetical protein
MGGIVVLRTLMASLLTDRRVLEQCRMILRRGDPFAQVVVPDHRELDRGTLRAIIRQAGLSVDESAQLLLMCAPQ